MYTKGKLMFLYTESLVHPGAGEGVGAIDLPIQREKVTNWPIIQGSGLKGSVREHFEAKIHQKDDMFVVFGPDPDKKDSSNKAGNPAENAGAVSFSDAKVMLFPVRSLKGTFAYITCPLAITRLKRDLEALDKTTGSSLIDDNLKMAAGISLSDNKKIWLSNNSASCLAINMATNGKQKIVLEELALEVEKKEEVDKLALWLEEKWESAPWIDLKKRLAVVSDDVFKDFVEFSTEVVTRNKINDDTGTVEQGALWNEECLPREVLMYSFVLACDPLKKKSNGLKTDKAVIDYIVSKTPDHIWLGGNQTVGRGILRTCFV